MRLVNFSHDGRVGCGLQRGDEILVVDGDTPITPASLEQLLTRAAETDRSPTVSSRLAIDEIDRGDAARAPASAREAVRGGLVECGLQQP